MPRLKQNEVAAAMPPRTPKQLANDARLRARKGMPSIHVKKNLLGPDDVAEPQNDISISTTGKAEATRAGIDIIQPGKLEEKAADEAFMNELVEIQIEADDDPNAPLFVHTAHNGVTQYIKRGEPQTIKRRFLYSLVAAKQAKLVCSFGKNSEGKEFNRLQGPSRCTHQVVVITDSDKGRQMYKTWMQMP